MTGSDIYKTLAAAPGFQKQFPMLYTYGTPVKPMTRQLIGRERQLRQLKAGLLRPELCNVLLLGEAGSGKALADDTLIPVADRRGYVEISELKVGDYVFDEHGQPTQVLKVFPQGLKPAYKVRFADKTEIICNDQHLWNIRSSLQEPFETLTLADMMRTDGALYVPLNGAVQRKEAELPVHPYVLGVVLTSCYVGSFPAFCIVSSDEYVINKVSRLLDTKAARRADNTPRWCFFDVESRANTKYIRRDVFLRKCGFDAVFSHRYIPQNYMLASVEQRLELLRGIMDTGSIVRRIGSEYICLFMAGSERQLALDVRELVCSLGMRAELEASEKNDTTVYTVRIVASNEDKRNIMSLPRFVQRFDNADFSESDNCGLEIESIENLNTEVPMTCIYVDASSHLFQAGKAHIVTHNTALVQGAMAADRSRVYLEIDISKMIADLRDNNEMAVKIKSLFDEAAMFVQKSQTEVVLFIDEFHLICMLSDAAVEALKPQLADSGTRGVRVIVATTFTEFREYISANQPLVQRLQRVEVLPPSKAAIVSILKEYAKTYGVADEIHGTYLYEQIIDLSNRYIPANSQPRKSILLLDLMVGWHRAEPDTKMDINLLYNVLRDSEGIELNVSVDAVGIKKRLDSKVFAQYLATSAVASRLQITSADLNNKTKPMGSFLFTGSTGVGKTELTKQLAEILFADPKRLIRFDMTEYSQPISVERFRTEVTTKVWERPYSVLLFDEIEKACGDVTRILLQVLDDGRLIDQNNREVSFLNTYIVLTTNAASEIYETVGDYVNDKNMSEAEQIKALGKYMKVIRRAIVEGTGESKFPPELLGRVDAICPFMPLSEDTQRKILEKRMDKLAKEVEQKHDLKIIYDRDTILRFILRDKLDTESNSGGARIVATKFEEGVVIEIARIINMINSPTDDTLSRDVVSGILVKVEGNIAADNKQLLEGDAAIAAYPVDKSNHIIAVSK